MSIIVFPEIVTLVRCAGFEARIVHTGGVVAGVQAQVERTSETLVMVGPGVFDIYGDASGHTDELEVATFINGIDRADEYIADSHDSAVTVAAEVVRRLLALSHD